MTTPAKRPIKSGNNSIPATRRVLPHREGGAPAKKASSAKAAGLLLFRRDDLSPCEWIDIPQLLYTLAKWSLEGDEPWRESISKQILRMAMNEAKKSSKGKGGKGKGKGC